MEKSVLESAGFKFQQVNEKKPTGLFLVGDFSFGDADGEKKAYMEIESLEELQAILAYLKFKDAMTYNGEIDYRCHSKGEKLENDFYQIAGERWREEYLWDGVLDWWERDPTNGYPAHLQSYWLIFRDNTGEYKVTAP